MGGRSVFRWNRWGGMPFRTGNDGGCCVRPVPDLRLEVWVGPETFTGKTVLWHDNRVYVARDGDKLCWNQPDAASGVLRHRAGFFHPSPHAAYHLDDQQP